MKRLLLLVLLVACKDSPTQLKSVELIFPTCSPDDGIDDRDCIQASLDAACLAGGGTVHLAAGRWQLNRAVDKPGPRDDGGLWLDCSDVRLDGEGASTVLMMSGDGFGADWQGVRISASQTGDPTFRVEVSNLTISSEDAFNVGGQTHLLEVQATVTAPGCISQVGLHNLYLNHTQPVNGAGDCLRFVGDVGAVVSQVDVGPAVLETCPRSGVSIQRGVQGMALHDLVLQTIGKTGVDIEPTGNSPVQHLLFGHLNVISGGISIGGQPNYFTQDVAISDSTINGRLGMTAARDVNITNVHVVQTAADGEGTLNIKGSDHIRVSNSTILRAGGVVGPAIRLVGVNGVFPGHVTISGGSAENDTATDVIYMESAQDVSISGVEITGMAPANSAIYLRATGRDAGRLRVIGNTFIGPLLYGTLLAGNPANIIGATVVGNSSVGVTGAGLRCDNVLKITKPVIHAAYNYDSGTATAGCSGVLTPNQFP